MIRMVLIGGLWFAAYVIFAVLVAAAAFAIGRALGVIA